RSSRRQQGTDIRLRIGKIQGARDRCNAEMQILPTLRGKVETGVVGEPNAERAELILRKRANHVYLWTVAELIAASNSFSSSRESNKAKSWMRISPSSIRG